MLVNRLGPGMKMYWFLIPLLFGFLCNLGSAFTTAFARRWGERQGFIFTVLLRDVLGVPIWAIGLVLAAQYSSPLLFSSSFTLTAIGWLFIILGGTIILMALTTIRVRAVRPSVHDSLAQTGMYAHMRHPIHTGVLLEFAGLVIVRPTLPMALASGLGMAWIFLQTWAEEEDLLKRLPSYRSYMNAVPGFIPRFWKK